MNIVLFSGGLSSLSVLLRVIKKYGLNNTKAWFFDTLMEDEDTYRFIDQVQTTYDVPIEKFKDGRNPWEVFRDEKFIGNSRAPLCNRVLKRELLFRILKNQYQGQQVTLFFGYDYTETIRMQKAEYHWSKTNYRVSFPLYEPPYCTHTEIVEQIEHAGIRIPRMYQLGFNHNNCGGACVQAGINQWTKLWKMFPERYIWHEQQEIQTREFLNKDVSILRDRTGNRTRPLTLRMLRERLEKNGKHDL